MRLFKYIAITVTLLSVIIYPCESFSQEIIQMEKSKSGILTIPCEVNDLKLNFIFDTGASDVHLSIVEAAFMLKNGYLSEKDFIGNSNYLLADGAIKENAIINLRKIKIGTIVLSNIKACVSSNIAASLLLGQSAIQKLGSITIDGNLLYINGSPSKANVSSILTYQSAITTQTSNPVINIDNNGDAVIEWPNGDKYVGYTDKGDISGFGTYTWANGDKYVGNWKNNKRNGRGTYYYNDGSKIFGIWIDDKLEGTDSQIVTSSPSPKYSPSPNIGNRTQKENISTEIDADYYIAQVSTTLNLREGPGTSFPIICKIPSKSYVLIKSTDYNNAYVKVLYIDENKYGYVSKNYLINRSLLKPDKSGSLTEKSFDRYKTTADVELYNNTSKYTTITIGGQSVVLSPHERQTIKDLKPGRYKNTASSPGVIPYIGIDDIKAGYTYSWTFYIKTTR